MKLTSLRRTISISVLGLFLPALASQGAVLYNSAGSIYAQDFDTLATSGTPAWSNDSTLPGWYWNSLNNTTPSTYTPTGLSTTAPNQVLSLGNSLDRAFGAQNGNDVSTIRYGVQLRNETDSLLTSFSLSYRGEQWRRINENGADRLTFEYQIFDAGASNPLAVTTGWTAVSSLDFTNTVFGGSSTGGSVLSSQNLTGSGTGFSWGDGQDLWLRWSDNNPADNSANSRRAGMGIDDISFTAAVPEPGISFLLALGGVVVLLRRRRRD